MQLVGMLHRNDPAGTVDFLKSAFPRLESEVKHTGSLTRHVQYESGTSDEDHLHFLGVEVSRIEDIPEGMIAWDLRGDTWTVLQPKDGKGVVTWREDLSWQWLDQSTPERSIGEFTAKCPSEWSDKSVSPPRDFTIFATGYIDKSKHVDDDIYLVDYDPSWPRKYDEMACWLRDSLGPHVALRVEHYGSTSIPGMPAKPVIDVLVEVPSFAEARKRAIPLFNRPECEYWWYTDHMCFHMRESLAGRRTHHIHVALAGHRIWEGLAFRDYLRSHPEDASNYAALKGELAARHQRDRERYTDAKTEFVREVTAKALQE